MIIRLPLIILIFLGMLCNGQQSPVKVTFNFNPDYTVDFYYQKPVPGNYLIIMNFLRLENSVVSEVAEVVKGMNGKFYTMLPAVQGQPVRFQLQYTAMPGFPNSKPDSNFVYLLPVSKEKPIHADLCSSFSNYNFFVEKRQKWDYIRFYTEPDDSVFAVRKGVVIEVTDGIDLKEGDSFPFAAEKLNAVIIEQGDGTLACYSLLKKGSITVKPGDTVLPYTPLAKVTSISNKSYFLFSLAYLKKGKTDQKTSFGADPYQYSFFNPVFSTTTGNIHLLPGNEYKSQFTNDQIIRELNKKEQKKLGK